MNQYPPRRQIGRHLIRVAVVSPRPDRTETVARALSAPRYVVKSTSGVREGSEGHVWSGVHVVVIDFCDYTGYTATEALTFAKVASKGAPIVALIRVDEESKAIKALANSASAVIFADQMTPDVLRRSVEGAYKGANRPPASFTLDTRECRAILHKLASKYAPEHAP